LVKSIINHIESSRLILDAGSGKGELVYVMRKLVSKGPGGIVMVDYAENMLRNAIVREDVVLASFEKLPFRDESFDVVMSSFALHAAKDIGGAIAELSRVSKGIIAVMAMGKSSNWVKRTYVGLYLRLLLPYLACLVGGKSADYKYIYTIYRNLPTNDKIGDIVGSRLSLVYLKERALGAVYLMVGKPRRGYFTDKTKMYP